MWQRGSLLQLLLLSLFIVGCPKKVAQPFDPTLSARDSYLCCNLHFNSDHDATDANYDDMKGGTMIPVGTRVKASAVGPETVKFRRGNDNNTYSLELRFGIKKIIPTSYFSRIFLEKNPTPELAKLPPETQEAVRKGVVTLGMTREEVIMSRGYPPLHETQSYESDDWLYYRTGSTTELVHFAQGRVQSITPGEDP